MSEILRQLLQHLKASVPRNSIVDILNMSIYVFLELGHFQVVVPNVIRIELDPIVPVELPDAHGDVVLSMAEWAVDLRLRGI